MVVDTHRVAALFHGVESGSDTGDRHVDSSTLWQADGTQGGANSFYMFDPTCFNIYKGRHWLYIVDVAEKREALLEFADHVEDGGTIVTNVQHHQGFDYVSHNTMTGDPYTNTGGILCNLRNTPTEFRITRVFDGQGVPATNYKFRLVSSWNCEEEISSTEQMANLLETETGPMLRYSESSDSTIPQQIVAENDRTVSGVNNVRAWNHFKSGDLSCLNLAIVADGPMDDFPNRVITYTGETPHMFRFNVWASGNQVQEHQIILQKSVDDGTTWRDIHFGSFEVAEMGAESSRSSLECVVEMIKGDRIRVYHACRVTRMVDGRGMDAKGNPDPTNFWSLQTSSSVSDAFLAVYAQLQIQSLIDS